MLSDEKMSISAFLCAHTAYDILPLSSKIFAFDACLSVSLVLKLLSENNLVAAPIWNPYSNTFLGLLTIHDVLLLVKENFDFETSVLDLKDSNGISMQPIHINPLKSLKDACKIMNECNLHQIPLIDADSTSNRESLVGVLSAFKILRFVACNVLFN